MRSTIASGVMLAVGAALAFGVTTPVIAWAGAAIGPLTTAALLYAGAAAAALVFELARARQAPLRRADVPRLVAVAIAGGAVAPTLLAWGLQRAGAMTGALLLNLEAVFTVALAWLVYREPIGRRVALAVGCMVAGGAAIVLDRATLGEVGVLGALAVAGATLAWAADNTWTRPLAERDPWQVILVKGAIGAALTGAAAVIRGEPLPALAPAAILLGCGATGYGASLRLYLVAQRRIGAARTGSVFALAPFIGAAVAWAVGDREAGAGTLVAAVLFGAGVALHVTERHHHAHVHDSIDHDHVHRHDDGHHDHVHDPPVAGEHSHPHHHDRVEHDHDHGADLHHAHH
ncbi:MAG: DMT family transporter [Acidobacteriota bacterium]